MSNLITIHTNDNMEQVINCRELHEKLGLTQKFTEPGRRRVGSRQSRGSMLGICERERWSF